MSEADLQAEIDQYKEQLAQIDAALAVSGDNSELAQVKTDLEEIIKLTEEALVEVKKQRLLAELASLEANIAGASTCSNQTQSHSEEDDIDLVGSKCRVFFNCDNTNIKMHNALVLGSDSSQENSVRVVFINPTNQSMKICEHFMNDSCRFNDACKFSHGHRVNVEDLYSYLEPNFENLREGNSCLVKHSDELWHLANIEAIENENLSVRFKKFNLVKTVSWADVYPLDDPHDNASDSDEDLSSISSSELESEEDVLPKTSNYSKSTESIGHWEKYTKGIGSKLMSKMGYVRGQGLGKEGEGRVLPVEVLVLPQGHMSLDRVMELKEKKLLKKKKIDSKKVINQEAEKQETDVFDFLNQTILKKESTDKGQEKLNKSDSSLNQINYQGLNIKMLETHNRIHELERHISKLKQSLQRNKNSDKATVDQIKQKLAEHELTLSKLKKTESAISAEKNNRKKKSDIF